MINIFDDCNRCDTADEKAEYLGRIIISRLSTPRDDFYLKPHYTSAEACKYLSVSKKTLDNLCSANEIARSKAKGRRYFLKEDLEEYVRRNRQRSKYKPLIDHYNLYN